LAFPKAHSKKGIGHAYHRFNSQCVIPFFSFQAILSLQIPAGEIKSEGKEVKTKKPSQVAGHRLSIERCTCWHEG